MGKRLQTIAAQGLMKTLLILFNTAFWASGFCLLVIGIWMQLELHKYMEISSMFIKGSTIPLIFVCLGGSIILFSTLACCCTAKGKVPLLYMYSSILLVIFMAEISLLSCGYIFREELTSSFHAGLGKGLQEYGKNSAQTAAIDDIQSTLQCCGLTNYTDWKITPWGRGHTGKLPHSCCHSTRDAICADRRETADLYRTGCYHIVVSFIYENLTKIGIGMLISASVHILGLVLTCLLAKNVKRAEYEEIRDKSLAEETSSQTTRMLQREDTNQVKSKSDSKKKRRKSRDLSETSLPPEQEPIKSTRNGSQQQYNQQRPRSSPVTEDQCVEMTAVLHNPSGVSGGSTAMNNSNNKSSATPALNTRHSHSGAHSPAIVQIVPQQQSESNCIMASPSHPSQMQANYHQQVPQAYQPPDYYNIQPQPQPPPPSAVTLQSRRHQLRSRESSRWSLTQDNADENIPSSNMEECCMVSSANLINNGGSIDVMQSYCPIQACAGTALDLSDAPLPPPPQSHNQIFQADSNNPCSYVMSNSYSQDPLEIVVSSNNSNTRCYTNSNVNNYQPQNVTTRLNRHSSSIEAIE